MVIIAGDCIRSEDVRPYGARKPDSPLQKRIREAIRSELHREVAPPSLPATHQNGLASDHCEVVGWPGEGKSFQRPTHPNTGKAAGIATHRPLEPRGMAHSASGGAFGQPQTRPASEGRGAQSIPAGDMLDRNARTSSRSARR